MLILSVVTIAIAAQHRAIAAQCNLYSTNIVDSIEEASHRTTTVDDSEIATLSLGGLGIGYQCLAKVF